MHDSNDKEWRVEWEDGTVWFLSWFRQAGSFLAERCFGGAAGPSIEAPEVDGLFKDLETLEAAMGRPLPVDVREELQDQSKRFPMTDDDRAAWSVIIALALSRPHPNGEFNDFAAPPGTASPLAIQWLPEWMS